MSFFYFFSDSGEVVTLEIPPRTLVAIPMKLLNRPIKHGVWDPEHEGLQVRWKTRELALSYSQSVTLAHRALARLSVAGVASQPRKRRVYQSKL